MMTAIQHLFDADSNSFGKPESNVLKDAFAVADGIHLREVGFSSALSNRAFVA